MSGSIDASAAASGPQASVSPHFASIDSAPKDFATKRPIWLGYWVLLAFTGLSIAMISGVRALSHRTGLFPTQDLVLAPTEGAHALPIRIFILCFIISYFTAVAAPWPRRLNVLAGVLARFGFACCLIDLMLIALFEATGTLLTLDFVAIISGLAGFYVFGVSMLDFGVMPERTEDKTCAAFSPWAILRLTVCLALGIWVAWLAETYLLGVVLSLRDWSLLGGIGPGVFLVLPILFIALVLIARVDLIRSRRQFARDERSPPDVTVLIPAHNESDIIEDTLASIDQSSAKAGCAVTVLVLNNCSSDDTGPVAAAFAAKAAHATIKVVDIDIPGKAIALNQGIEMAQTEIVVRVDADTQLFEDTLALAMRHFRDPQMGVLGGVPVPPKLGFLDEARWIEILLKHAFYQVSLAAINGTVGVPGMFVIYRRDVLRELGGFATGMNGEDTDISLRIGELGYHVRTDPAVRFLSEVPLSYRHLREQRLRWFRSTYHVIARNRYVYLSARSLRGLIVLPYMLTNTARRTMMVPLVLFGLLDLIFFYDWFKLLKWQAVFATLLGAPFLLAIIVLIAQQAWRSLLFLPEYLVFRVIRAFLTLESALTIKFAR